MYGLEIQKFVAKANLIKNYDDKIELLKQAIAISDSKNDIEWGISLRKSIMEYEYYTPHFNETYLAINWLVGMQNNEPDLIDDEDFLWNYKHVISEILYNPDIPKATQDAIEKDYLARMEKNGYSKRPYYDIYYRYYTFLKNNEKAAYFLKLRNEEANDDMSNCEACELDNDVSFSILEHKTDEALAIASPLLTNKMTCSRVPLITLINFTVHYTEIGDLEKANTYFLDAMKILEEKNDTQAYLKHGTSLLSFLINSNQLDMALTLIEKAFDTLQNASAEIHFLTYECIYKSLSKINEEKIEIQLPEWVSIYEASNQYNVQNLLNFFKEKCNEYITKIDNRNGNDDFKNCFQF